MVAVGYVFFFVKERERALKRDFAVILNVLCEANTPVLRTRLFVFEHVCMYTKYTCIHASALVLWDVL